MISALESKRPCLAGKIGSDDLWLWYGRKYWCRSRDFEEDHENSFIPDCIFDRLTNYVTEENICRGYRSEADAMRDFHEAVSAWEMRNLDYCGL